MSMFAKMEAMGKQALYVEGVPKTPGPHRRITSILAPFAIFDPWAASLARASPSWPKCPHAGCSSDAATPHSHSRPHLHRPPAAPR